MTTAVIPSLTQANAVLPDEYRSFDDAEVIERIEHVKRVRGPELTILGHHYQDKRIVRLSDHIGDSFGLSEAAAREQAARYIVFCGVHFMAESAKILCRDDQVVLHPDLSAGCPMADMADIDQVEWAWDDLMASAPGRTVIPVTYMNSDAELKAFCGRNDGIVCTSSNAGAVFDWAYERGDAVLFFPDEHLGWNTGRKWGLTSDETALWDPRY
ncbi:MAG: quinolinate synthase NadA, partial [Candidatus Latescibacteria bacterium]|nr:quinolinate synthase NadA [Candidatus Latescibacterota bacterium]